jgi:uncharacterized membrane protein YgdD (TMEM256/DUF423 family)
MIKLDRNVFVVSLAFIIFAVILGALGAHALAKHLTPQKLASFETGVRYQLFHGIGLIALIAISNKFSFSLKSVYLFLIFGVIFFSFSIYLLSIQELLNIKLGFIVGPITPIGGLLMIIGWSILLVKILSIKTDKN